MLRFGLHVARISLIILQKSFVRLHKEFYRVCIMAWDVVAVLLSVAYLLVTSEPLQHSADTVTNHTMGYEMAKLPNSFQVSYAFSSWAGSSSLTSIARKKALSLIYLKRKIRIRYKNDLLIFPLY